MSRLVVKNLPKAITEARLRDLFGEQGTVTDVQLKYTKDGVFRQFAFVGYQNEEQAAAAITHFHRSCIQTNRITVEPCVALGADAKPKSWSKYASDSSAFRKVNGGGEVETTAEAVDPKAAAKNKKDGKQKDGKATAELFKEKATKKKQRSAVDELLAEHKSDPQFVEFMKTHAKGNGIWENDWEEDKDEEEEKSKKTATGSDAEEDADDDNEADDAVAPEPEPEPVKLADQDISDADYMKQLMKKKTNATAVADQADKSAAKPKKATGSKAQEKADPAQLADLLTIKIRNIPFKTKRQDVLTFFKPLKPFSVRLPTQVHGICYVGFKTEADFKKAMLKNRSFWKGKQILLTDFTEKNKTAKNKLDAAPAVAAAANPKWAKQEDALRNEEDISESGRIFFRNLAYTVCEADLRAVFEPFGPVAECNLPIDVVTRAIKGFGTVTFVMPEHAVRAFSELDGTIFHGRLFHLIPGKSRDDDDEAAATAAADGLSFKQRKQLQQKKEAGSAHNWNTLFMGADQVANVLATTYGTSKEHVLDAATGGSGAAVRLALGETEIIIEMKAFLERNDVVLDAFEPAAQVRRSGTVIVAKNLPAGTTARELQPLFGKFGPLGRLVLPPSGVTALVEFLEPTEARAAFRKLAYSKFKTLPLYLEWAPEGAFRTKATQALAELPDNPFEKSAAETEQVAKINAFADSRRAEHAEKERQLAAANEAAAAADADLADDTPAEPETTLFLRNLNFATREPAIRQHFAVLGKIHSVQVALKKDPDNPQKPISLGYGFIQFKRKATAERALQEMQFTQIEGNKVELKRSDRTLQTQVHPAKKTAKATSQTGTKIMVRNIPFQAKQNEIQEIFQAFAEVRTVRLPLKMAMGEETHRGFGFVDFYSEADAKKAFEALSQSTHLYGRRLVLEWAAAEAGVDELRKRTAEHFTDSAETAQKRGRKSVFDASGIAAAAAVGGGDDDDE